jgi:NIMA (never in mitosis gene a)-related kinase 1/4/5
MEDFEILSKLGKKLPPKCIYIKIYLGDGAYSSVYKAKRIADGEIYALKKVKLHHLSDKEKENAINEVRILASIKHNNIISYKESFLE